MGEANQGKSDWIIVRVAMDGDAMGMPLAKGTCPSCSKRIQVSFPAGAPDPARVSCPECGATLSIPNKT